MLVLPAHLQREGDVFQNRAMGEEAEGLKHHAHLGPAHVDQFFLVQCADILPVDLNRPAGDLMQAGKTADQRGLAGPGQSHDDEHLAAPDFNGNVLNPGDVTVGANILIGPARLHSGEVFLRIVAKELPYVPGGDDGGVGHEIVLNAPFGGRVGFSPPFSQWWAEAHPTA